MKMERFASPSLACATAMLTDTRSGVIARIIETADSTIANYVLQTSDGLQFCVSLDTAAHVSRNDLLMLAFESCLPVTVTGDNYGNATAVAIGHGGSTTAPVIACTGAPLTSQQSVYVRQVYDELISGNLNYTLQAANQSTYCAFHSPGDSSDINAMMLRIALIQNMPITLVGGDTAYITDMALGNGDSQFPALDCMAPPLTSDTKIGQIIRIIKENTLWQVFYVIQEANGTSWCVSANPNELKKFYALLFALDSGATVAVTTDDSGHITKVVIGNS